MAGRPKSNFPGFKKIWTINLTRTRIRSRVPPPGVKIKKKKVKKMEVVVFLCVVSIWPIICVSKWCMHDCFREFKRYVVGVV